MALRFATGQRLTADLMNDELIGPVCQVVQQTAQTGWTTGVATPVTFAVGSTVLDTDAIHSESSNTSRLVIGTKLGIWEISGVYVPATSASATTIARATLYKNGSFIAGGFAGPSENFTTIVNGIVSPTIEVEATASTDYIELWGTQTSVGTVGTAINTFAACSLKATWLRHT